MTEIARPAGIVAIVVNFRTAGQAIDAIRSLQTSEPPVGSIIVVDNGSNDDSVHRIQSSVVGIRLIEEPVNRGFSGGCNVGIRAALDEGADRVLLLNADALVQPTALACLSRLLDEDERIGIAGPMVVSKTAPKQIESFGISYSRVMGRMWNRDFGMPLPSAPRDQRRAVDAVSGCAMLIKRAVFERVGLFDEDYFFGFEDVDFCLRARVAGFESAVVSTAIVEHEGHASIGTASNRRIYFATRNHLLLAERGSRPRSVPRRFFQTLSILGLNLAYAVKAPGLSRAGAVRAFVHGARDHFAGRYGPSAET